MSKEELEACKILEELTGEDIEKLINIVEEGRSVIEANEKKMSRGLEDVTKIIETYTPIDIKDKQPTTGQRCNVYDVNYKQWVYAVWGRDCVLGTYNFEVWGREGKRTVSVTWWLPERDNPEEEKKE